MAADSEVYPVTSAPRSALADVPHFAATRRLARLESQGNLCSSAVGDSAPNHCSSWPWLDSSEEISPIREALAFPRFGQKHRLVVCRAF